LLYVLYTGVVGNAAWEVFPASARFLSRLFQNRRELDAIEAARRAVDAAARVLGVDEDAIATDAATKDGQGVWHVALQAENGRRGEARLDPTGHVTHIKFSAPKKAR
jgi:2-phospho-L-lactate transferase/gluconeogenesis factor (CofD/UPF0052 family)